MSQAPTDGLGLLDPFGFWKTARDTNLEAWSKFMIDLVNSDEYAQATGLALEQALATSQPLRDAMERTMTQTLSMLNMPSRAEVISLADRLVNVEMRLDDLDAKLTTVQKALQETIKKAIHEAMPAQNPQLNSIEAKLEAMDVKHDALKKVEAHLVELSAKLDALRVPVAAAPVNRPSEAPKPEPKPRPTQPAARKDQEAK